MEVYKFKNQCENNLHFHPVYEFLFQESCQALLECEVFSWNNEQVKKNLETGNGDKDQSLVARGEKRKCFLKSGLEGTNRTSMEGWISGPKKCRLFG